MIKHTLNNIYQSINFCILLKVQELKNFSDQSHEVLSDLKLQYEQTVLDFQKELKLCTENGAKMKQHILKYLTNYK